MSIFTSLDKPIRITSGHVPRMGFDLTLKKTLDQVKWHGRGPGESYPDKQNCQQLGICAVNDISQLLYPYDIPQESGNHTDTR
jgi:beta-galactosidase